MPGLNVPGAAEIGNPGLNVPGLNLGPLIPATTAGTASKAMRLGSENNAGVYSGANTSTQALGATFAQLGSSLYRAVKMPSGFCNVPASGDYYIGVFVRTQAVNGQRAETLFACQGQTFTAAAGGAVQLQGCGTLAGAISTGADVAATAGLLAPRRQNSTGSWQWWPQTTVGAAVGGFGTLQLLPDTDYLVVAGITGTFPILVVVKLSDGTVQTVTGSTAITGTRPTTAALFDQLGALGSASATVDALGWGGDLADVFAGTGTFPSTATLQGVAAGTTAISGLTGLKYWNTLDPNGSLAPTVDVNSAGSVTLVGSNIVSASPIRNPSAASLLRLGNWWVFPVTPGTTAGLVWFELTGTPGTVWNCRLNYTDGTFSTVVPCTIGGTGYGAVPIRSPASKPFHQQFAPANGDATNTFVSGDIMDVGLVIVMATQSEGKRLGNYSATSSSNVTTDSATGATGHSLGPVGSFTAGPWACHMSLPVRTTTGFGNEYNSRGSEPRPVPMLGSGNVGDGYTAVGAAALARSGYSVMVVDPGRSGTPMDYMIVDGRMVTAKAMTATAGVAQLALTTSDLTTMFPGSLYSGIVAATYIATVGAKIGTVTFTVGGVTLTEASPPSYPAQGAGGVSGFTSTFTGGAYSLTLNYVTGAITAFTSGGSNYSGAFTTSWTVKIESLDSAAGNKTTQLCGFGVGDAFDKICQRGLRYGFSVGVFYWATANESDSGTVAGQSANFMAKRSLVRERMIGSANYPGCVSQTLALDAGCAAPKFVIAPKGRETSSAYAHAVTAPDICRQADLNLVTSGSGYTLSWAFPGSWYTDIQVEVATSPHEDASGLGGRRMGRRFAADIIACFSSSTTINDYATWGTPTFSGNVATIPLSHIYSGGKLTVGSGGNAAALDEWYVGTGNTPTLFDNSTSVGTAAIRADGQAVTLTKASGNWAGTETFRYLLGAPGVATATPNPPPASLLYDDRGGFTATGALGSDTAEPGLPVSPKFA